MMMIALRHFRPPVSTAHNARMELRFGGCFRQDRLMRLPHNFIDAQNATTLGATMPNRKKHTERKRRTHIHIHTPHTQTHAVARQSHLYTLYRLNLVSTKVYSRHPILKKLGRTHAAYKTLTWTGRYNREQCLKSK